MALTPPAEPRPWFRIEARAAATDAEEATTSAEVYIYDEIGESWWGGIAPKALIDEINALEVDVLHVLINSPGGAAWDGVAIMNALRRHKARIEVTVDGLAASAASVIAMAGDHITMNRGSEMMIHDAWGYAMGSAQDMQDTAGILGKLSDSIADIYAARAGGDRAAWRAEMQAETWYTAEEAVTAGLADAWADQPAAKASFDRSKFSARASARQPRFEAPELPRSSEPGDPNRKELPVSNLKDGLRTRLGVNDAEASEETLLAALDEKLSATTSTPAVPEGTTLIDSEVLAGLQADAAQGRQAREEQIRARREGIVSAALNQGRIAPASREQWLALLAKDEEGASALISSLPASASVPVDELGHSDSVNDADEALYARVNGNTPKGA